MAAHLVLHPNQVHIWQATLPQVDAQALHDAMGLLSFLERAQHGRFHFEKDRHCYLVTRWMVRTVLSRYVLTIAPADWTFAPGPYGRPQITNPLPAAQALRNLPAAEQALRFWELWTFKESYIKARGMGVRCPWRSFRWT